MQQPGTLLQAHRGLVVAAAAVLPLAACALFGVFRDAVANTTAAITLVLLIVAAAATGVRAAGLVAAVSCAAWFDFFLTSPYHHFTIDDPADVEIAVLLVLVGVAVTEIALWGRRQQARASRQQGYLDGVLGTAASVGAGRVSTALLVERVCAQIVDVLEADRCRFDPGSTDPVDGPVLASLADDGTLTYDGRPYDVDRLGLPTDTEVAVPVQSGGVVRGRLLITAATRIVRPTLEQRRVVVALAHQVGAALATAPADRDRS